MTETVRPEPWLRGTLAEIPVVARAALHALELAQEDLTKWCGSLSAEELNARPGGVAPVAFHIRHIARSMDRLLTYAEGGELDPQQQASLKAELEVHATNDTLFAELKSAIRDGARRIRVLAHTDLEDPRCVGAQKLPSSLGGLLVHIADHTQRHVGQAITTAKVVVAQRRS